MRQQWAVIAGLGILLASAGAWAQEASTPPGVLVLSERNQQPAPMILRGTPAPRSTAAATESTPGIQIAAGKRLWVIDQASGEVRSCINQQTTTVGLRVVSCTSAELGPYHRTFGRAFQP
jgi:hypothetical protein